MDMTNKRQKRIGLALASVLLALLVPGMPLSAAEPDKAHAVDPKQDESAIVGEWWTEKHDGRVRFSKYKNGTYTGILTWGLKDRPDVENPNPKLRSRSIFGIVLMWKLHYEDQGYQNGYVYNPEDGNTYRMEAEMVSRDKLKIHGYVGISLFGQSQIWTRYK